MSDEIRVGAFLAFALLTVGAAIVVAFARAIIYSVFALLFAFMGVAGLYVLLHADFLAATQVMIYVGGILVLLLFGVMLTHKIVDVEFGSPSFQRLPAGLICLGMLALLLVIVYTTPWPIRPLAPGGPTTQQIGRYLMTDFLLPFEVISVLLFAVLVGAAAMARGEARR
ncbi:MAG: NADH-quinone oxidoreductase subunit J [Candidatus Eisenbacteria bacterium]|nr:NADH-quinone oxidoreductase subunit J [Candidatus Eisenbacteria bacterium]